MAFQRLRTESDCGSYVEWECPECKKSENSIERLEEEFRVLVKLLYSKGAINPHSLHNILCDMESYLERRDIVPMHLPTVQPMGCLPEIMYPVNSNLT